jgi:RNA polymerase sigma-70 factor (ECF subfamily)
MKKKKFRQYTARYKDLIYSQAYYFTRNREDAADITQEVLLKMWLHFNDESGGASIHSWLLRVTKNQCIDHVRRKREPVLSSYSNPHDAAGHVQEPTDSGASPEQQVLELDLRRCLEAAIEKLPPKIRMVVIMREIHYHSYREIADALDLPLNSVKVCLHRGRKMIFEHLKRLRQ